MYELNPWGGAWNPNSFNPYNPGPYLASSYMGGGFQNQMNNAMQQMTSLNQGNQQASLYNNKLATDDNIANTYARAQVQASAVRDLYAAKYASDAARWTADSKANTDRFAAQQQFDLGSLQSGDKRATLEALTKALGGIFGGGTGNLFGGGAAGNLLAGGGNRSSSAEPLLDSYKQFADMQRTKNQQR